MANGSAPTQPSSSPEKKDSVTDLLDSIEKIKGANADRSINFLFSQNIEPANLKEKFLYATFEIIAENGAHALSASELIKRTKSSKGALFHHFETIDDLCIESLHYFRKHLNMGFAKDTCATLEEYLNHVMTDNLEKQSTRYYVHLTNFFRDRSIRDDRFKEPLRLLFEVNLQFMADRILEFLPAGTDRDKVFKKVLFVCMTIERASFHRALYREPQACEVELEEFLNCMTLSIKNIR